MIVLTAQLQTLHYHLLVTRKTVKQEDGGLDIPHRGHN